MLDLSQEFLIQLSIYLVEEVRLLEWLVTLSVDELEHISNKHLCQLIVVII